MLNYKKVSAVFSGTAVTFLLSLSSVTINGIELQLEAAETQEEIYCNEELGML